MLKSPYLRNGSNYRNNIWHGDAQARSEPHR